MSDRSSRDDEAQLMPWEQTFNGATWHDMPGQDFLEKAMNFALFRRGKLDLEMDGETRKLRCVRSCFTGAVLSERAKRERDKREARHKKAREVDEADAVWRAGLRLKLTALKSENLGAVRQLARAAEVHYDNLLKFIRDGIRMGVERLRKIEATLAAFEPTPVVRRKARAAVVPAGHVPFAAWLRHVAERRHIQPHTVYVQIKRGLIEPPPIVKVNGRAWFVDAKEVAA